MSDTTDIRDLMVSALEKEQGSFEQRVEQMSRHGLRRIAAKLMDKYHVCYDTAVWMIVECQDMRRDDYIAYLKQEISGEEWQERKREIDDFIVKKYAGLLH